MLKKSIAALLASLVLVSFSSAALAGDPIPGLDVKLGKNPGGIAAGQTRTGPDGKFAFDNLTPGSYRVQITPQAPTTRTTINTTRSNIKHGVAVVIGVQVVTIAAELGVGVASTDIQITAAHGRIVGTVTRAAAASAGGAR